MKKIFNSYQNGEISRKEVCKKASEIINIEPEKLMAIYEEYFKPSQEECSEIINESCKTFENFMQYEEEKFEEFIFYIADNNIEKIREIRELSKTI